jgi:hypothetical protein
MEFAVPANLPKGSLSQKSARDLLMETPACVFHTNGAAPKHGNAII